VTAVYRHAFTVDVEDYFHVNAFESFIDRANWPSFPSRVDVGVNRLLELLARHDAHGTFFTLGWVAQRYPQLVRRIADAGHEVASHGFWHRRVVTESPDSFSLDIADARDAIEQASGTAVLGYRAPSFSIIRESEWALERLVAAGYRYDSSRFPVRRSGYGSPHVPLAAHVVNTPSGPLAEIPLTVWEVGGLRIPSAGGGWFRQFPFWVTQAAFEASERNGRPGVFYIHPWELDPDQPVQPVGAFTRVRHYRGLNQTVPRLERLLQRFRFSSIKSVFELPFQSSRVDSESQNQRSL
jgi:polysaccharide deacetylase family protein (PEP-CTERM system associated)